MGWVIAGIPTVGMFASMVPVVRRIRWVHARRRRYGDDVSIDAMRWSPDGP